MALEFFLYQVSKQAYRLYWGIMVGFNMLFAVLWVAARFFSSLSPHLEAFPDNTFTAVLIGANLVYLLAGYWIIDRYSTPFATLIGSMAFSIVILNGLSLTDPYKGALVYAVPWLVMSFFSGIYGLPVLASSVFMAAVYILLQTRFEIMAISPTSWLLVSGTTVLALLSYFFWKSRFVSVEDQKLSQLSGMLQSNKQQSEILVQSIADGIIMTDTTGRVTLINPAAASLTEWPIKEAIGMDVRLVAKVNREDGSDIPDDDDPFTLVMTEQKPSVQTLKLEGREGKEIIISLSVSPVLLPGENEARGSVAVLRDISEARAEEKQRGEFISTASHEMRTPVAAIEGYLALALNDKVSSVDSRARSFLEKAHASTQHLGKLFQDLLTSSKAEDGRLANHPIAVEMGAFMEQLADDLKFAAEKKGLLAEFVIGSADETVDATTKDASVQHLVKPLYYSHVDPDRMREVITNLFDNACKYTDSGKVTIGLTGDTDVVQIYIRDTGAGIPAADIPHLFQKFYRVDNSATRTIGGTGLGLFISRKIVELYKGRIWVESQVGKGSTFFINLPRLSTQRVTELQGKEQLAQSVSPPSTTPSNS